MASSNICLTLTASSAQNEEVLYVLNGLIASVELLKVVAAEVPAAQVLRLQQGLALILMTEPLHLALHQPGGVSELGFASFPGGFALRLSAWSQAAPIAYVEATDEGEGSRRAGVWENGRLVLGPLYEAGGLALGGGPISQALQRVGAGRGTAQDEFEAVGLGRFRDTPGA